MDHLPQVLDPKGPSWRVPCVCDPSYFDGMEFETFPIRKGFTLVPHDDQWPKLIFHADGSRLGPEALAPIVQAWLFFGLIIEVLKVSGVSVDVKDLIQSEGENTYVTMTALSKYLFEWEEKERILPKKDRQRHYRRQQYMMMLSMCFQMHQLSGQWFDDSRYVGGRPKERYKATLPFVIEMSIVVLTATLNRASRKALGILDSGVAEIYDQNPRLTDYLKACYWCPSEVYLAQRGMDDTLALFASRLDRKSTQADHTACSTSKCMAFNIVTEQYKTKHDVDVDCPGCQHISIDAKELSSILVRGQTPRASLQLTDFEYTGPIRLSIKESGPYVAISHVWSDGLGNPNANSLPVCQLLRLHKMAAALDIDFEDGNPAIWIDSLLVPVNKGHEKRLALNCLSDYYQAATKVLVLDSDLLQTSQACTKEELMTRVFLSTWMRRLWTLEEGILSRGILEFQLQDGTVSLSDLGELSDFSTSATAIGSTLKSNMLLWLPKVANCYRRPAGSILEHSVVEKLLPALEFRSTTKVIDEPLCIAHILGLDASKLVVIDDAHLRMRRLLELLAEHQAQFQMSFLFTKEPKLQMDGFRWAPASFMTLDPEDLNNLIQSPNHSFTFLTYKGLLVSDMNAFTLRFQGQVLKKVTYAEADKRIYAISPVPGGKSCLTERYWTPKSSTEASKVDPTCWDTEMQAMLGKSPETTAVLHQGTRGVLVSYYGSETRTGDSNGVLVHARYISRVYVQELKTESQNFVIDGVDSSDIKFTNPSWDFSETEKQMQEALNALHDPETSTFLRCEAIDRSQRWCIG